MSQLDRMRGNSQSLMYLVRHGEAEPWPLPGYATPPGPPLTERGQADAHAAARFLEDALGTRPVRIIHSPMRRARETARIIADRVAATSLQEEELIMEIGVEESGPQVQSRMVAFHDAFAPCDGVPVIVAGHRAPIESLLCHLTDTPLPERLPEGPLSPDACFYMVPGSIYEVSRRNGARSAELVHGSLESWPKIDQGLQT